MTGCLINGRQAHLIEVRDRGLAYGDGLFETIALRAGRPRFFDYHYERLVAGCERLAIPAPPANLLRAEIDSLAGDHARGVAKLIVTRGPARRGYAPPAVPQPTRIVSVSAADPVRPERCRDGIAVRCCATPVAFSPALAGLKTLNRLEQVLARAEWREPDIAEGLMATAAGNLVGGTMSNLFLIRGEILVTPALDEAGVRGVMRRVVLELAAERGLHATEQRITAADLMAADELFISNSQFGIWPVVRCAGRSYPVGSLTRQLLSALVERGVEECGP